MSDHPCASCGHRSSEHCSLHTVPCCPGRCFGTKCSGRDDCCPSSATGPDLLCDRCRDKATTLGFVLHFSAPIMDAREAIYTARVAGLDVIHGEATTRQEWILDVG